MFLTNQLYLNVKKIDNDSDDLSVNQNIVLRQGFNIFYLKVLMEKCFSFSMFVTS
jgi:hypothetical protein